MQFGSRYFRIIEDMEKGGGILTGTPGPPMISDVSLDPRDIWVIATFDHYLVIPIDSDSKLKLK